MFAEHPEVTVLCAVRPLSVPLLEHAVYSLSAGLQLCSRGKDTKLKQAGDVAYSKENFSSFF